MLLLHSSICSRSGTRSQPADREHRFRPRQGGGVGGPRPGRLHHRVRRFSDYLRPLQRFVRPVAVETWRRSALRFRSTPSSRRLGLVLYQSYVVRRTKSVAIAADSLHYKSDLALNACRDCRTGPLRERSALTYADPLFAIGIAAVVLLSAWRDIQALLRRADGSGNFPQEVRQRIREIATASGRGHRYARLSAPEAPGATRSSSFTSSCRRTSR